MKPVSVGNIVRATGGRLAAGKEDSIITDIKQDSRICREGDMFVAIKGENHDGHKYVPSVIEAGCTTVLISDESCLPDDREGINAILVDDTVYSLGDLAAWYLDSLNVRKVAVTGSVGKTSVRDMIYYVLCEKYNAGRNMKNYNNDIGLPLSIFQFDENTEAVVLEMGMNHFGEIDRLASIVKPDIAVITNIGVAHVENLGSREGIFRAKMEVTSHLKEEGCLIYAWDNEFLTPERTAGAYSCISAGTDKECDYVISEVDDYGLEGIKFSVVINGESHEVSLPVPGVHNAVNACLAMAAGELLGISAEEAEAGLAKAELTGSRLKVVEGGGIKVIDDTYNASTDSMKSALKVLESSRCSGRRIAILGDMFELGEESRAEHEAVGKYAGECSIDLLLAVGEASGHMIDGAEAAGGKVEAHWYRTKEELYPHLGEYIGQGDVVLVKGSRGMKMEEIIGKAMGI